MHVQQQLIKDLLTGSSWFPFNKTLARIVGVNGAVLFSFLADKEKFIRAESKLTKEGFFYCKGGQAKIEQETALSKWEQQPAIKKLKKLKFIETKLAGTPATIYYKLCDESFLEREFKKLLQQVGGKTSNWKEEKPPTRRRKNLQHTNTELNIQNKQQEKDYSPSDDSPSGISPPPSNITRRNKPAPKEIKTKPMGEAEQLSILLRDLIKERNPNFKDPDLNLWTGCIDKMIRLDNRVPEEIKSVILWCQQDEFWQNNILSTDKLRIHFDQLSMKKTKSSKIRKQEGIDEATKFLKDFIHDKSKRIEGQSRGIPGSF